MELSWLVIAVVVLATLTMLVGGGKKKRSASGRESDGPWPFYAKRVLSKPEQVLYHSLVEALPDHIVLAQVQLSRFLGVNKGENFHAWNNRINRMSADFLICTKDTSVVAVIELDD